MSKEASQVTFISIAHLKQQKLNQKAFQAIEEKWQYYQIQFWKKKTRKKLLNYKRRLTAKHSGSELNNELNDSQIKN